MSGPGYKPRFQVVGPGSGSWVSGSESWVLDLVFQVLGLGSSPFGGYYKVWQNIITKWQLLQRATGSYYKVWQEVITKCDRKLLQSATRITKRDRKLSQSATCIIVYYNYYKVWTNTRLTSK